MRKIKAFILDLDGVITDTAEYHYLAWKCLANKENIKFDRNDNEKLRGVSRKRSLELLLGNKKNLYSSEQFEQMMDRKNKYYQTMLEKMSKTDLLPGAMKLIESLKSRNIKIAIGSASKNAKRVLNKLQIIDGFDAICDGYSVKKAKPAPDLFLHAASELNVKKEECVVVEDAKVGIEAALSVGMIAVGIGPKERVGKAHFRYNRTKDISLEEVLSISK